jgi:hypothetical protein
VRLEAARQTDLGGYADLLDAERVVGNLPAPKYTAPRQARKST